MSKKMNKNLETCFRSAVRLVQLMPKDGIYKPSMSLQLKFYGLFKQAEFGSCNTSKPAIYLIEERLKWNAWKNLGNLSKEDAKKKYIEELKNLIVELSGDYELIPLLQAIEPFLNFVNYHNNELTEIKDAMEAGMKSVLQMQDMIFQSSNEPEIIN